MHFVYGCTVSPGEISHETINDSSDAMSYSWDFKTVPVKVEGYKPTSMITIDSRFIDDNLMNDLMEIVYGEESRLPYPDEIVNIMYPSFLYKMIDLGYISVDLVDEHLVITLADLEDVSDDLKSVYSDYILPMFDSGSFSAGVVDEHIVFNINNMNFLIPYLEDERLVISFE